MSKSVLVILIYLNCPLFCIHSSKCRVLLLCPPGTIPPWLEGALYRDGPGVLNIGDTWYHHVFDGMAVLHKFAIKVRTNFASEIVFALYYIKSKELTLKKCVILRSRTARQRTHLVFWTATRIKRTLLQIELSLMNSGQGLILILARQSYRSMSTS